MIVFVILLLFIMFSDMKVAPLGGYLPSYMDRRQNNCIKGIFILLIVLSHYSQYITPTNILDDWYKAFAEHLNQGVVAMFFFYSGYGMMESIKKKGYAYVKAIPTQRFLKVWFNFAVAVTVFWMVSLAFHKPRLPKDVALAYIGWSNVGNSSWYMFAIFSLYLLTFIAFIGYGAMKENTAAQYAGTTLLTILTAAFVLWQIHMGRPMYAYDTLVLFPFGFWYSLLREKVESILWHNGIIFTGFCVLVAMVYSYAYFHRWEHAAITFTVWIVAFTVAVVLITMKVSFESPILEWFGKNLFWVYILQRLPMNILSWTGVCGRHKYFALVLSIIVTVFLVEFFDALVGRISSRLFGRKQQVAAS